jgi:O-antigen/teichoic acid export membrane protein
MGRAQVILRNVAANWLGFVVAAATTLLLTPIVLRELGTARYGVWVLTMSIVGHYGLLDLGFRAGITQFVTRSLAAGDTTAASEYLSSALVAFVPFAVCLALISVPIAHYVPGFFGVPDDIRRETQWCVLIVGITSAVQFAFFPFSALFPALQRFDLSNYIGICSRLASAAAIVYALRNGYGLVGISAATCIVNIVDYVVRWRVAQLIAPYMVISPQLASFKRLRETVAFGGWNFLISVNFYAYQHLPNFIIAAFMRVSALGHYALATGLCQQINTALNPIGQVMYPAAAAMHASGDSEGLRRLYHDGTRLLMIASLSAVLVAGLFARNFYLLWVGPSFANAGEYPAVPLLLQVLLVSVAASFSSSVGAHILMGSGRIRTVAALLISGSVISLAVSLAAVEGFGLMGVALATVSGALIIDLLLLPFFVQRELGLRFMDLVRSAYPRIIASVAASALILVPLSSATQPTTWPALIGTGAASALVCAASALLIGATPEERRRFLIQPLRRRFAR